MRRYCNKQPFVQAPCVRTLENSSTSKKRTRMDSPNTQQELVLVRTSKISSLYQLLFSQGKHRTAPHLALDSGALTMNEIGLISVGLDLKISHVSHTTLRPPSPNCSAMINLLRRAPPPLHGVSQTSEGVYFQSLSSTPSSRRLPCDRSTATSKASSRHSAIYCSGFQFPVPSFLTVIQQLLKSSPTSSRPSSLSSYFSCNKVFQKAVPMQGVTNSIAFTLVIERRIFRSSTPFNTPSFLTQSVQLIFSIILQRLISKFSRYF